MKAIKMNNRRDFLCAGSLLLSPFVLPSISCAEIKKNNHNKAIIWVWLGGGISHQDSFVVSPTFTEKARPVNGHLDTVSGFKLGGDFPKLAAVSKLFSPVYSFGHINPSHGSATHYNVTGYNANSEDQQNHPSMGSLVNKKYGPTSEMGVPHYVSLDKIHADTASYLGNTYNPFNISEQGKQNLVLNIEKSRFNQRMEVMNMLDKNFLKGRTTQDVDGYKRQGREMLLGSVREVFEVKNEPENVRSRYGDGFPAQCMMARRLIENGVKFVTIHYGGWDMHTDIKAGYAARAPQLDHGLSILLQDLSERGLLDSTMVVVTTEFSRTLLNAGNGRDHHPGITTLALAGGDYQDKGIIGSIEKDGMFPKDKPFGPLDLLKTVMNHMDISGDLQYQDTAGRPQFVISGEARIIG